MTTVDRDLAGAANAAAATGTDPELLGGVVAWLAVPRQGPAGLRRAVQRASVDASSLALRKALPSRPSPEHASAAATLLLRWAELGCRVALVGDRAYPTRLARSWPDGDVPPLLAWRGELADERPAVALVGARRATGYGTGVAAWLAGAAAEAGVRVVSGGAVGIDAAAHRAAADAPGATTVVLGCGHAVGYPRVHAAAGALFDQVVAAGGAVVSELFPDVRPSAGLVRARNRLVAGLSDLTVVVEGGPRSGALLTAGAAAEQGGSVMAVPGDVRAPGSAAPHRLLSEGVPACTHPRDLLEQLHQGGAPNALDGGGVQADAEPATPPVAERPSTLPKDVHRQLIDSWPRPTRLDDLAAATGRAPGPLLAAVTRAQVAGELAVDAEGVRLRRRPGE